MAANRPGTARNIRPLADISLLTKLFEIAKSPAWAMVVMVMFLVWYVTLGPGGRDARRESSIDVSLRDLNSQLDRIAQALVVEQRDAKAATERTARILGVMCVQAAESAQERRECIQ